MSNLMQCLINFSSCDNVDKLDASIVHSFVNRLTITLLPLVNVVVNIEYGDCKRLTFTLAN